LCTRDLLAYRSPDLDAIYPELVASADGSITVADVEKRRQARALQKHKSDQMDAQFELQMANKKSILTRMVTEAVEKNASGLLQELRAKNPLVESVTDPATGTVTTWNVNLMYDGTGMMIDFLKWLDRDVRDDEEDYHLEVLTELKRHPLPSNGTEAQLTAWSGDFTANHNPLLGRHKLEGEALSRCIIKSLPDSLEQSKAALLSELKRDKAWAADYHAVLERCAELVRQVHHKTKPTPTLGLFGIDGIAYNPPSDARRLLDHARPRPGGTKARTIGTGTKQQMLAPVIAYQTDRCAHLARAISSTAATAGETLGRK
jgi:hypothetical protein